MWGPLALTLLTAAPSECGELRSPFGAEPGATLLARVHSRFGAPRNSYVRGHKHAGVDLRGEPEAPVFPICPGRVVDIQLDFPHLTVVVRHRRPDGRVFHSSYKHVAELRVAANDLVTPATPIARLFSRAEHQRARFGRAPIHLHLEILRRTDDGGAASWRSMTRAALERYRRDPLEFFKRR